MAPTSTSNNYEEPNETENRSDLHLLPTKIFLGKRKNESIPSMTKKPRLETNDFKINEGK